MRLTYTEAANAELLHAELTQLLGTETFAGIVQSGDQLEVVLNRDVNSTVQRQIAQAVEAHDATRRTAAQQAELDRAAQAEEIREQPLDLSAYTTALPTIKQLAERVAWLEREVLRLARG